MRAAAAAACFFVFSCFPTLQLPTGSQLACDDDDGCPDGARCVAGVGLCVPNDSPCIDEDGAPVGDGTACDGGVCVSGVCRARGCGDGVVDLEAGEECDPLANARCRADCTLPFCGDGIVDADESCDDVSFACRDCVLLCIGEVEGPDDVVERRSNCDLASDNGCECDADELVLTLPDDGYVWHSKVAGDVLYFIVNTPRDAELFRYRAGDDEAVSILGPTLFMALSESEGEAHVLSATSGTNATLSRLDDGETIELRGGLRSQDLISFAVVDDRVFIALRDGLFTASTNGDDALAGFSDACAGLGDVIHCDGRLYCSSDEGVVRAVDVETGVGADVYGYTLDDEAPRLLCHEGAALLHDVGALFLLDGEEAVLLARFSSAGGNAFAPFHALDAERLLLTEAFGAAGPYGHVFELATGRLTPVTRGFPIAPLAGVLLTDDSTDSPQVFRVPLGPR